MAPLPSPAVSPTPVASPSPVPTAAPDCVISASPDTAIGLFSSTVVVAFRNIQVSTAVIKCMASETGETVTIGASGVGGRSCSYPAVPTNEAYVASATSGSVTCNTTVADMATPFPIISAVANTSITTTSALITWTTDQSSDSQVEYGPTSSLGSLTTRDTNITLSHSVSLSPLAQNTTYYYKAKSCNSVSACTHSDFYTFTTLAATIIAPTVTLNTPATNAWQKVLAQTFSFTPTAGSGGTLSNCTLRTNVTGSMADTLANTSALTSGGANLIAYTFTADHDYSWNVRCYNVGSAYGEAGTSYVVKLDSTVPGAPGALSGGSGDNLGRDYVYFTWTVSTDGGTNPSGVASYTIYQNSTSLASGVTDLFRNVTGLSPSTTYSFEVEAVDAATNVGTKTAALVVTTNP